MREFAILGVILLLAIGLALQHFSLWSFRRYLNNKSDKINYAFAGAWMFVFSLIIIGIGIYGLIKFF